MENTFSMWTYILRMILGITVSVPLLLVIGKMQMNIIEDTVILIDNMIKYDIKWIYAFLS